MILETINYYLHIKNFIKTKMDFPGLSPPIISNLFPITTFHGNNPGKFFVNASIINLDNTVFPGILKRESKYLFH